MFSVSPVVFTNVCLSLLFQTSMPWSGHTTAHIVQPLQSSSSPVNVT